MSRRYIIAVDFDGTVVKHEYPFVGEDVGAVPVLKKIAESGNKIILNTMRSHKPYVMRDGTSIDTLQEAIDWFEKNDIPLYGVNENPDQKSWTDSKKAYANMYIDDSMVGCPLADDGETSFVDWKKIEKLLEIRGVIESDFDSSSPVDGVEALNDVLMQWWHGWGWSLIDEKGDYAKLADDLSEVFSDVRKILNA